MAWKGISDFLAMGGYGIYVWGSYGVALICVLVELILLSRRKSQLLNRDPGS